MKIHITIWNKIKNNLKHYLKILKENQKLRDEIRIEARLARIEERKKQVVNTETYREKIRGEKERKFIKDGGAWGALQRGTGNLATNISKNIPKNFATNITPPNCNRTARHKHSVPKAKKLPQLHTNIVDDMMKIDLWGEKKK